VITVVLPSVTSGSDPWNLGFSISDGAAVAQGAGTDAVGAEWGVAVLLPDAVKGHAALCPSLWLTSSYTSSLLKESV
jgi:hypothetical protein